MLIALTFGLLALFAIAFALYLRRRGDQAAPEPDRRHEAAPPEFLLPQARRRVLVVATEPLDGERLEDALGGEAAEDLYVVVIAPQLVGRRWDLWFGDTGEAQLRAQWVRDRLLAALDSAGVRSHGHLGAPDLGVAVTDGLRAYTPDVLIVARRRSDPDRHLEDVALDDAAEAFGVELRDLDLSPAPALSH